MRLYFSPGACSLSPHIVLREAGLSFELEQVDLPTKKTRAGVAYATINPKGAVPALQLDDGQVLTEGVAIVQYLADQKPEANLAPAAGTMERYRLQEWLNYIASELHKAFSPLFRSTTPEDAKREIREGLRAKFEYVNRELGGKPFLLGDRFSVADAYLFTILTWAKFTAVDLSRFPALTAYYQRIKERPAVQAAIEVERKAKASA
jgi:glutathione S-transferase